MNNPKLIEVDEYIILEIKTEGDGECQEIIERFLTKRSLYPTIKDKLAEIDRLYYSEDKPESYEQFNSVVEAIVELITYNPEYEIITMSSLDLYI